MAGIVDTISMTNPVFSALVFWSTVMLLKMLAMSALTGMKRFKTKTFANPEDAKNMKVKPAFGNEEVERVRRAHLNDLENIIAFVLVGFFYTLTAPSAYLAVNLFRVAAIGRLVHTVVYAIIPMQPARALAWFACYATTIYMGIQVLFFFM